MLPAPPLLSPLLWRPCSPPALVVTACKEMLDVLYSQRCLARAASEPPGDLHPLYICGEVGDTCAAACSRAGGVWGISDCSADLNSLLGLWQGFADTHRLGSYDWLVAQVMCSTGTWKGTEILGLHQNPSSSSSTIRWYWFKDGGKPPRRCSFSLPSTPSLTLIMHIQWVSLPSFPWILGQLLAFQNDCGHVFWFFFPHKIQNHLGWVKLVKSPRISVVF